MNLYESEIYKHRKIGDSICRWGVLTQYSFKYFKNQYSANCWANTKHLFKIPITHIVSIKRCIYIYIYNIELR